MGPWILLYTGKGLAGAITLVKKTRIFQQWRDLHTHFLAYRKNSGWKGLGEYVSSDHDRLLHSLPGR